MGAAQSTQSEASSAPKPATQRRRESRRRNDADDFDDDATSLVNADNSQPVRIHRKTKRVTFTEPTGKAAYYYFMSKSDGAEVTWKIGSVSASAFANTIQDADEKFLKTHTLAVMFQVNNFDDQMDKTQYLWVEFHSQRGFTLSKILDCIYYAGTAAAVSSIKEQFGEKTPVNVGQVKAYLANRNIPKILIKSGQPGKIYVPVSISSSRRRS